MQNNQFTFATMEQRFWSKVKPPLGIGECWEWMAGRFAQGYGEFKFNGRMIKAHRLAYELLYGLIPEGKVIDHLCRNRGCVNPYHLEPVTFHENILRGEGVAAREARQTHCKYGHELTEDNLCRWGLATGKRYCKICDLKQARTKREKRKLRKGPIELARRAV